MGLNIEKNYYNQVTKENLEKFIENKYGVKFDFCKDQNCVSGINCLYDVKPVTEYEFEAKKLSEFITVGVYKDITPILLANMVKRSMIPQGKYLIIT